MSATRGEHLVLYDGVCAFCHGSVQFVLPRDRAHRFDFATLQSPTGRRWMETFGRNPNDLDTFVLVSNYRGPAPVIETKARAALSVAGALGLPWRLLTVLRVLPRSWLDTGYGLIAKYRYRVFGKYDACPIPSAEQRARFVDL
jgi:predicted DCC family thiol-disulfide oxidoreductase YuxK